MGAIRLVMDGGTFLEPIMAAQMEEASEPPLPGELAEAVLTPREMEVLMEVAWGHTNMEVAAKLHLSVKTVEVHKAKISEKFGLSSRAQIVRYALRRGWLRDE